MNERKKAIKSDLNRLDQMTDDEIDYSEIPEADDSFWKDAVVELPKAKTGIYIRLDSDVLEWMKAQGKGYQSRINAVLRAYYEANSQKTR